MLYPAELRGRLSSRIRAAARGNQLIWVGGMTGSGSGATGTPSSTSDLACSSVALPWTCSRSISPLCIARAVSAKLSPTQRESLSISACTAASRASGLSEPLRGTRGAIGAFADVRRLAERALHQARVALLLIVRARAEPGFECLAALAALKVEDDHKVTASGIGAAVVKRGYARTHVGNALQVDLGKADARLARPCRAGPRPTDRSTRLMAEGLPAVLVVPDLRRSDDEQPSLDRAGAKQDMPVRFARSGR